MSISLSDLGLTQEELQGKIVEHLCNQMLHEYAVYEEGDQYGKPSPFRKVLEATVTAKAEASIAALAERYILPQVGSFIENLCLQETNKWGEKQGAKFTFIEYLTKRADAYLVEPVDYEGRAKGERDSWSSWNAKTTRIAYMVDKHLQYSIETAMKQAVTNANAAIAEGIEKAVKIKLEEIVKALKVKVETK